MTKFVALKALKDPIIDTLGYDPNDEYCERFWLPILGPTAFLLLKRIIIALELSPEGFHLNIGESSQALGLGLRIGKNSPVMKSLNRYCVLGLGKHNGGASYVIRRSLPPLSNRQIRMFPDFLNEEFQQWLKENDAFSPRDRSKDRALKYANTLIKINACFENPKLLEKIQFCLIDRGFKPSVTNEVLSKIKKKLA